MAATFSSVPDLCTKLEGTKVFKKILIANNGLAAVKGIRSIRDWLYDHLGDTESVQFAVMATPEDMASNAEFVRMADQHVEVPGGSNANNYANVELIVNTAVQLGCDAVYPGWGHASENPALPRDCEKSRKVTFLGPPEGPMFALGDKIASSIIAQSNGVPCIPWSGQDVRLAAGTFKIDEADYEKAYVRTADEAVEVCKKIGFPVMIKASEGGGGKGIRKASNLEEVPTLFEAVQEEVKGCHIFIMRMLSNIRHLEVQLLADRYGNCIAVRTRDCSTQRRHQKIIEEGPVIGVREGVVEEMEAAAIRLAHAVGYVGLGTVEYMYDRDSGNFHFLELNPRIQVEHPVSELISGVNLPAALMCVGMGIPLYRIPEIRAYYGEELYGTEPIDFKTRIADAPRKHTIAVRVTAEDVDEGFRPTTGKIDEVSFRNSRDCWGYFSVSSGGAVHQFADSQFGHIFCTGETREEARRGMVMALRGITVRGEIRTSSAYVRELLETEEFRENKVNTQWLDGLIANRTRDLCDADVYPALAAAAITRMRGAESSNTEKYGSFLQAGHVPSVDYLANEITETLVLQNKKFTIEVGRLNANEYAIGLNGSVLVVPTREFSSGALQLTVAGRSIVAYCSEEPASLRVTINGKESNFTSDVDPTKLRSSVPGRLVRFLVPDGGHVESGSAFAEVEVMKMILPLKSGVTGTVHIRATAGCTVNIGKLLAEVEPDDLSSVTRPEDVRDTWPDHLVNPPTNASVSGIERVDSITRARQAIDTLWNLILGFNFSAINLQERVAAAIEALPSLCLSSVSIKNLNRAFFDPEDMDASTPNDKMRALYKALVNQYLSVEQWFDGKTRQEALDKMRDHFGEESEAVRTIDFAHNQSHRHEVLRALLEDLEKNRSLMNACADILSRLSNLQSNTYGVVLLQARYLQRQASMPSFDERKALLAKKLEEGAIDTIIHTSFGFDLMCAVMFDPRTPHLAQLSLELFIRRSYFGIANLETLDIFKRAGMWQAAWRVERRGDDEALLTDSNVVAADGTPRTPNYVSGKDLSSGWGFAALYFDEQEMQQNFGQFLTSGPGTETEGTAATVFVALRADLTQADLSRRCFDLIHSHVKTIQENTRLETITFVVHGATDGPSIFTFTRERDFGENTIIRNLIPNTAFRLELHQLANYELEMFATPHRSVHIFTSAPKGLSRALLAAERRLFVRMFVSPGDLGLEPWATVADVEASRILSSFVAAMEYARAHKALSQTVYNHLFINLVELTFDVSTVYETMKKLATTYAKKFYATGFREVEIKFKATTDEGKVPFRIFITNKTGYALQVNMFVETYENGRILLKPARHEKDIAEVPRMASPYTGSTEANMDELTDSPDAENSPTRRTSMRKIEALRKMMPSSENLTGSFGGAAAQPTELEPYPVVTGRQLKRLQAQAVPTTYVHDWAVVFEVAIRKQWKELVAARKLDASVVPTRPVIFHPMAINAEQTALVDGEPTGTSLSGMCVWRCEYRPPSYLDVATKTTESRNIVIAANDITFQSGSFSVAEDVVFKAASDYARAEGLPFVYLSANSGARLGLSAEVKKMFRVAMRSSDSFDYIYLTDEDLKALKDKDVVVNTEHIVVDGESRNKIVDIIGRDGDYLGVENLQGSALIAGHMSLNYSTIPTISVATGRTVGIGAYLVRLGRRVVQTRNSPIILTGASALNRLLGKEVYTGNNQLGGNSIMQPNGVSHWGANDDLAGIMEVLKWADFVPKKTDMKRCEPRVLTTVNEDPIDRDVTFTPARNEPYNPRHLIEGNGVHSGMFDKGSWVESLADWAKTVVTGRATLGGLPCGVILVETRITKKFDPADPADPNSTASFLSQAGQVWFPDSARKTADALEDFHHERLPCFVIANWRGFSGGMRDMFDEVLKFGASIVDNLRIYTAPVFIYIPPFGELRGGAWVVVDPVINHNGVVEMYCDTTARGGILEPAGVVEIKFRENDLRETMRRNDSSLRALSESDPSAARHKESSQLPLFNDIAIHFADLHDTPGRMKAKGCVVDVIPWVNARRIFHKKLTRKLQELRVAGDIVENGLSESTADALVLLQQWCKEAHHQDATIWGDDDRAAAWMQSSKDLIDRRISSFGLNTAATRMAGELNGAQNAEALATKVLDQLNPATLAALKASLSARDSAEAKL